MARAKRGEVEPIETDAGGSKTPDAIVLRAAEVFAQRGFAATTVREIGEAVGIRSASLYYHFPSKEKIFVAVSRLGVELVFAAVRREVDALPEGASHRERIGTAIRTHLIEAVESGPCTKVNIRCSSQIPADVMREVAIHRRPYEKYWRDLFRAAIADGAIRADADPTLLSLYVFGFMNWTLEWFEPGRWTLREVAEQYTANLFDGVAARARAVPRVAQRR